MNNSKTKVNCQEDKKLAYLAYEIQIKTESGESISQLIRCWIKFQNA